MAIRAVVLDIGGVLEVIDDDVFPAPTEARLGLAPGAITGGLAGLPGDAMAGGVTEAEIRAEWQRTLGLDDAQVHELVEDYWRWYVGTLDRPLLDWFAAQRPSRRTGILSTPCSTSTRSPPSRRWSGSSPRSAEPRPPAERMRKSG